jgi:hypothetical protein
MHLQTTAESPTNNTVHVYTKTEAFFSNITELEIIQSCTLTDSLHGIQFYLNVLIQVLHFWIHTQGASMERVNVYILSEYTVKNVGDSIYRTTIFHNL